MAHEFTRQSSVFRMTCSFLTFSYFLFIYFFKQWLLLNWVEPSVSLYGVLWSVFGAQRLLWQMQEEEECCLIEKEERSNNRWETFYLWLFHILCFLFLASQRKLDCPSNMKLIMEYAAYLLNFILCSAVLPML